VLLRYRPQAEALPTDSRRYNVLRRLASGEDLEFLRRLPTCTPELERRFQRDRRRVFRAYLREIAGDFRVLYAQACAMAAVAPQQDPDLIADLLRRRARFWSSLALIEVRLAVSWVGIPSIDLSSLLSTVESVQSTLSQNDAPSAAHA
jgi:hypothetical protein